MRQPLGLLKDVPQGNKDIFLLLRESLTAKGVFYPVGDVVRIFMAVTDFSAGLYKP